MTHRWNTPNGPDCEDTVQQLVESMQKNGWEGTPLLVRTPSNTAFNGSHRQEAAKRTGTTIETTEVTSLEVWDEDLYKRYLETEESPNHALHAMYCELHKSGDSEELREAGVETW